MSVQTIIHTSLFTLAEDAKKSTIDNANKMLLKKRFELGEGYCEDKQFDNSMICEIINTSNCSLTNYINEIIECGPDEDFVLTLS